MKPNGRDIIQRIKRTIMWIYYETQRNFDKTLEKHTIIDRFCLKWTSHRISDLILHL
jgi:hypothetical protein